MHISAVSSKLLTSHENSATFPELLRFFVPWCAHLGYFKAGSLLILGPYTRQTYSAISTQYIITFGLRSNHSRALIITTRILIESLTLMSFLSSSVLRLRSSVWATCNLRLSVYFHEICSALQYVELVFKSFEAKPLVRVSSRRKLMYVNFDD